MHAWLPLLKRLSRGPAPCRFLGAAHTAAPLLSGCPRAGVAPEGTCAPSPRSPAARMFVDARC